MENNYVYPPDAVNKLDLDGKIAFIPAIVVVRVLGPIAVKSTVKYSPAVYRTVRSAKTAKEVRQIGHYTKITWTVNARNAGGAARAVYTKVKGQAGKAIRFYKDTYNRENKFMHRKYKL